MVQILRNPTPVVPAAASPAHLSNGKGSSGLAEGEAGPQGTRPPVEKTCPHMCARGEARG